MKTVDSEQGVTSGTFHDMDAKMKIIVKLDFPKIIQHFKVNFLSLTDKQHHFNKNLNFNIEK